MIKRIVYLKQDAASELERLLVKVETESGYEIRMAASRIGKEGRLPARWTLRRRRVSRAAGRKAAVIKPTI